MEKFKKGNSITDGASSETDWITVENGTHISIEKGQTKSETIEVCFGNRKKIKDINLPPKEYAELCSAIITKHANRIPKRNGMLYKNSYYSYTYSNEKITCIGKIAIEGNEDIIKKQEEIENGRIK